MHGDGLEASAGSLASRPGSQLLLLPSQTRLLLAGRTLGSLLKRDLVTL